MEFCETYTLDLGVPQCKSNLEKILDRLGYVSNRQDGTLFSRGSLFGSITSFSPKKWKAKLEITYRPKERYSTEIFIRLKVNTTGQKVTPREVGMLSSELSAIAAGVMGDFCGLEKVESSERLITKSGWIGAVVFLVVATSSFVLLSYLCINYAPGLRPLSSLASLTLGFIAAKRHWQVL